MKYFKSFAIASLGFLSACGVDTSGLLPVHDHPIGPNTVRVEVHDMRFFDVVSTGDSGAFGGARDGELRELELKLSADREIQSVLAKGALEIVNVTDREEGVLTYTAISAGDQLRLGERGPTYQNGDLWVNAERGATVSLTVRAQELDCTRERLCTRRDTGTYVFEFDLPRLPDRLSDECGRGQRFVWDDFLGVLGFRDVPRSESREESAPVLRPSPRDNPILCITPAR
ncbi:hypothetical protein [Roseovarius sp. 2305UL8-3]|uniref:hypothetical protein n=1 Tax=Roseovarius conchicola TaxID=3121636 RepID=UPI003529C350